MAVVLCVLYEDPVDGYPTSYARDAIPSLDHYPGGQTLPSPSAVDFTPGQLLGSVSGALGLRDFLESNGHTLVVTSDKEGPDSEFDRRLPEADVVISQPFWPAYLTAERIARAPKLKLALTAGIGSDHVDLDAAIASGITVAEVTYSNSISVSEHVVMMILGLVRNYLPSHEWVVKGGWNIADCAARSYDLEGMVVGTVAAGRIGQAVLRRLKPFDVELHYTDRHRLDRDVERELGLTFHPDAASMVPRLRRGHHQCAPTPRDRAPLRRRHVRPDEAGDLPRQYRPGQDLRSRRRRPGPGERSAGGLRRRCLVPPAGPGGPPVADDAPRGHDPPRLGDLSVGAGALCRRRQGDPRVLAVGTPDPRRVPDRRRRPAGRHRGALLQRPRGWPVTVCRHGDRLD